MSFITEDTWIISDTHFLHHRIAKYADRPINHDEMMMHNWNTMVKPDDNILHLGDVFLAKTQQIKDLAPLLTGNKFLIKGNHDSRRKMKNYCGFTVLDLHKHNAPDGLIYTYYPATVNDVEIIFSHKPVPLQWFPGVINLHGHIHINPVPDYYTERHINMCVELHQYMPKRLGQVLEENNVR